MEKKKIVKIAVGVAVAVIPFALTGLVAYQAYKLYKESEARKSKKNEKGH